MGCFTTSGREYEPPAVPEDIVGANRQKAFIRGWHQGIWNDRPVFRTRYKQPSLQALYERGHAAARQLRREAGETLGVA